MTPLILGLTALLTFTAPQQAGTVTRTDKPAGTVTRSDKPGGTLVERRAAKPDEFTNVRLDLTITDKTGEGQPVKKTVTLLLASGGEGRVRSSGMVFRPMPNTNSLSPIEVTLNADARIFEIGGDKLRAMVTVEYAPSTDTAASGVVPDQRGSTLNQSVLVILTSGKPAVIVESSDPLSDRKVTLEATATILR